MVDMSSRSSLPPSPVELGIVNVCEKKKKKTQKKNKTKNQQNYDNEQSSNQDDLLEYKDLQNNFF